MNKTILVQDIYQGRHYRVYTNPAELVGDIQDINSANLVSVPEEFTSNTTLLMQYVEESIQIGDCVNVLQTLLEKEKSDAS